MPSSEAFFAPCVPGGRYEQKSRSPVPQRESTLTSGRKNQTAPGNIGYMQKKRKRKKTAIRDTPEPKGLLQKEPRRKGTEAQAQAKVRQPRQEPPARRPINPTTRNAPNQPNSPVHSPRAFKRGGHARPVLVNVTAHHDEEGWKG